MSVSAPPFSSIDDFGRADENPLAGIWSGVVRSGDNALKLSSNQVAHATGSGSQGSAITTQRYIRPFGFSIKLSNASGDSGIDYCLQDTGGGSLDGYRWQTNGTVLQLYKITDNGFVKIGGDYAINAADGDEMGVTLDYGGVHKLYFKTAAGSWTLVDTVTDTGANEFISGRVGIFISSDASARLDDFNGYQVPPSFSFPLPSIVDDFNRADENPIGTNWSTPTLVGFKSAKIASSAYAHQDGSGNNSPAWYNIAQYTSPFDIFTKLSTVDKEFGVDYSLVNPGLSTASGYRWQTNAGGVGITPTASRALQFYRFDSASFTKLGGDWIIYPFTGDQIGARLLADGTHYLMYRPVNGAWQVVSTISDSTYSSGYAGLMIAASTITRLDDFGVGSATPPSTESILFPRWVW